MSVYDYLANLEIRIANLEIRIAKAEKRINYLEDRLTPADSQVQRQNMFHNCDSIGEVIRQAVGAGSVAWWEQDNDNGETEQTFDSEHALRISDDAEERIGELMALQWRLTHPGSGGGGGTTACAHGTGAYGGGGQR